MDPFILNLGIRWLAAVDAFSACCVSREWRRILAADRDNGDLWKQICRNSGPSDIPTLASSADYRRLAMNLRLRDTNEPPAPQERTYAPATRPEDYFVVLDVYKRHEEENGKRRKELVTSLMCPISDTCFEKSCSDEMLEPILQGENPYSANMKDSDEVRAWRQEIPINRQWRSMPLAYSASVASRKFPNYRVDLTLFRRDNAKSLCLIHDAPLSEFEDDVDNVTAHTDFVDLNFAGNDTGMIARGLIDEHSTICVECYMTFVPKVPPSGSDDEPQWLVNSRQALEDQRAYEPTASDMTDLSKIDYFEFGLNHINVQFYTVPEWDGEILALSNQNELIIALEGLCWE